jgi:hypothetical protein
MCPSVSVRCGRIVANLVSALGIVLLLVNPSRALTPICALLALAVALWVGPVLWRMIEKR